MKEIKAYVQRSSINKVVESLEKAGVPGITIVEVHPVGYGYDPNYFEPQYKDAFKKYRHHSIVKLEIVCADGDVERFVQIIRQMCSTGSKGDGRIFLAEVATAIRIRDGACGEDSI